MTNTFVQVLSTALKLVAVIGGVNAVVLLLFAGESRAALIVLVVGCAVVVMLHYLILWLDGRSG